MGIVFVYLTDEHGVMVFPDDSAATAYCEGIDVEAGEYLFWDSQGAPLKPVFTKPNTRGRLAVSSGEYHLVPTSSGTSLIDYIDQVSHVDGSDAIPSVNALHDHLQSCSRKHHPTRGNRSDA